MQLLLCRVDKVVSTWWWLWWLLLMPCLSLTPLHHCDLLTPLCHAPPA